MAKKRRKRGSALGEPLKDLLTERKKFLKKQHTLLTSLNRMLKQLGYRAVPAAGSRLAPPKPRRRGRKPGRPGKRGPGRPLKRVAARKKSRRRARPAKAK